MRQCVLAVIFLLGSLPALAELVNPAFDSDLSGWAVTAPSSVSWSSDDADGSNLSGSVELIDPVPGNGGTSVDISQCINLQGAEFPQVLEASAKVIDEGEPGVGATLFMTEYRGPGCTQFVGFNQAFIINSGTDAWETVSVMYAPNDAEAVSVALGLGIEKEIGTGTGGRVRYDNLFLGVQDPLFQDRFENVD